MKGIKTILKSIDVAFSIYSKIPMPKFNWDSSDMKYHLCFFPWVGAVIGGLEWLWYRIAEVLQPGRVLFLLICVVIPLLITGGFHVDGFMDTMDAIHSYQEKEKKLEILKDPHIGAFSVICLVIYLLLLIGFLSEVNGADAYGVLCCSFYLSRCLSGLGVISIPAAQKDGMLQVFSTTAEKQRVRVGLFIQLVLGMIVMLLLSVSLGLTAFMMLGISFVGYCVISRKQFGGITGDLAGCFVTVSELMTVIGVGCVTWLY